MAAAQLGPADRKPAPPAPAPSPSPSDASLADPEAKFKGAAGPRPPSRSASREPLCDFSAASPAPAPGTGDVWPRGVEAALLALPSDRENHAVAEYLLHALGLARDALVRA
eukprot:tig00020710_g13292.t1